VKTEWGWRNSAWKWKSTWRSECNWRDFKLSSPMQKALRQTVLNDQGKVFISQQTLRALQHRKLIGPEGEPTPLGIVFALSLSPLKEQCKYIGLEIVKINIKKKYRDPAVDGMYHFLGKGNQCCYSEGVDIRKLIYCLYFHKLSQLTKPGWKFFFEGTNMYPLAVGLGLFDFEDYVNDFETIEDDLVNIVLDIKRDVFLSNYRRLYKKGFSWFGADEFFAIKVFEMLGQERLARILKMFFMDRYAFSVGWPDLTVIIENEVHFVEIKTTDKLIISQLITIPEMIKAADLSVKIFQISRR